MMVRTRLSLVILAAALFLVGWTGPVEGAEPAAETAPTLLALVGPDSLTTDDLGTELSLMFRMKKAGTVVTLPEPEAVLDRLIQNFLLIQEGYRMDLGNHYLVTNQVTEIRRDKAMKALLDSIADTAPAVELDRAAAEKAAVDEFVEGLKVKYDVAVDSTLLRSLDYASPDAAVHERLRSSDEALVALPWGNLTIQGLTRTIRFKEFHGLGGRPDAGDVRDEIFANWLAEALTWHEARALGFDRTPELQKVLRGVERGLVLQTTLSHLLKVDFEPGDDEVEAFYQAHLSEFTAPPKVKLDSAMLPDSTSAATFADRLRQGAKIGWLRKQTPEVVPGAPPFSNDWYQPSKLGLGPDDLKVGFVPEPFEVPGGGFVVAVVSGVGEPEPRPLESCRSEVLGRMKNEFLQGRITDIVKRLENETEIRIMPGAVETVARFLEAAANQQ